MAGFWFLVSIILIVMLVSRNKNDGKDYAQGYWDGYREFGSQVQQLISSRRVDASSLQKLVDEGMGNVTSAEVTPQPQQAVATQTWSNPEDNFVTDVIGEDEIDAVDTYDQPVQQAAPVRQNYSYEYVQPNSFDLTPEEKAKRSLRNLNLILYTASFLLVAAGALFVASSSSAMVKLVGVCMIIAIFYLSGYIIYTKVERLRPAGLAFLGTGLALIPFAGFAFQDFSHLSAVTSWLITSIVGLVAYFAAAILLQSQLVSYLTMAFVLSLACSTTATGTQAIVWQFVAIIGISLIANVVAYFKPQWLPSVFSRPIEHTGHIVTPVALVASLIIFDRLRITDYEIVFTVATLHYIVAWLQSRTLTYETIIRILSYVVMALFVWDISASSTAVFAFTMALLLTLQHAYSLVMIKRPGHAQVERVWIGVLFALQFLLSLNWLGHPQSALFTTIALLVVGATSYAAALRLRSVGIGIIGLVVSLVVPFTVVRGIFAVPLPWWVLALWFGVAAIAALWGYAKFRTRSKNLRAFMTAAYVLYVIFSLVTAHIHGGEAVLTTAYLAVTLFALAASYIARAPYAQLFMPFLAVIAAIYLTGLVNVEPLWRSAAVGGGTAVALILLAVLQGALGQALRQALMVASGLTTLLIIYGTFAYRDMQSSVLILTVFLAVAFATLALRWLYRNTKPLLSSIFMFAYPTYFVAAVFAATTMGTASVAVVTGLGVVLFLAASYIEREKWVQVVSAILTVVTLGLVAELIPLAYEWRVLFTFGLPAALFFAAAGLHYAYMQPDRQLLMTITAYVTLFFVSFTGTADGDAPRLTAFIILLAWAVLTLGLRWWNRDNSPQYEILFKIAYPLYYIVAVLIAGTLPTIWLAVAFALGACLVAAASYAERAPKLEIPAAVLTVLTLIPLANVINVSAEWFHLFVFGIAAGIFCLGAGYHRGSGEPSRQLIMVVLAQITLIWVAFTMAAGNNAAIMTAFAIILVWSVVSLALRWWSRDRSDTYSMIFAVSYVVYYFAALVMAGSLASIWGIITLAVGAVVFWIASYAERAPFAIVIGNVFFAVALVQFWSWAGYSAAWAVLGVSWILAGLFYFGHWIFRGLYDETRAQILLWSAWVVLLCASFIQSVSGGLQIPAMATLIAFAATLAAEGVWRKSRGVVEAAVYIATFGAQRIVSVLWPELNVVFYGHWWALTLIIVSLLSRTYRKERMVLAALLITATSGLYALTGGSHYQLLFLVEHLALLVIGAILSRGWAIWWGIIATAVAILYFLRSYTFLLLGFLGLLLIAIVVWRLMRSGASQK